MAKLYFYYASMNAGKSTTLLQADFNYRERGMVTMLWTAALDDRYDVGAITSRIGLSASAHIFTPDSDVEAEVLAAHARQKIACVLVDEAQFLSPEQVHGLARLADEANIPVVCYGLRTDFAANLFPGSAALLGLADALVELKGVCECGRKATMNLRVDGTGRAVLDGAQTEIGGNDRYVALCRKHFMGARIDKVALLAPIAEGDLLLEQMAEPHRTGLRAACAADRDIWAIYPTNWRDDFDACFDGVLNNAGRCPFAILLNGEVVGMSGFLNFALDKQGLEIGNSYIRPDLRGSGLNGRVKQLLLARAFGCGIRRVEFRIDERNARSQAAVAKLGAVKEGVLRAERILWNGFVRDTGVFSILADEWATKKGA